VFCMHWWRWTRAVKQGGQNDGSPGFRDVGDERTLDSDVTDGDDARDNVQYPRK
jgi:hypothetical protein